jgi:hypothetical protein
MTSIRENLKVTSRSFSTLCLLPLLLIFTISQAYATSEREGDPNACQLPQPSARRDPASSKRSSAYRLGQAAGEGEPRVASFVQSIISVHGIGAGSFWSQRVS